MRNFVARQPIVIRAVIVIAAVATLRILAALKVIPPDWAVSEDQVQDWIDVAIGAWAAWSAWRVVTPVAAPKDGHGRRLIPATYQHDQE